MKKLMFLALLLFFLVVAGTTFYAFRSYHLVRDRDGFHFLAKKEPGFELDIIDTRDWKWADYLKNSDITKELAKIRWQDLRGEAENTWQNLNREIEAVFENSTSQDWAKKAENQLEQLRKQAKKRYDQLENKLKNGEIDGEAFRKQLAELKRWFEKQMASLRAKFDN